MARNARLFLENVSHHIVGRGSRKDRIFYSDEDYERFLSLLWKYKNKFKAKLYAYCLMPNHIHLLLDTATKQLLSKTMHGISLSYAMYFNSKYKKCGHLWQNRYKNNLVRNDQYLLNVVNYIEYNPVKAGICTKPEEYPWSSYRSRVLGEKSKILDDIAF